MQKIKEDSWIARMIVTKKKDGNPRRVIDYRKLNKAAIRQFQPSESPKRMIMQVPKKKFMTVIDMWQAFHSIPLNENYTTFGTQ